MHDVRGDSLGPPHGVIPAAVTANKILELKKISKSIKFINSNIKKVNRVVPTVR